MANMIITSECEECRFGEIDESDKAKIKVLCTLKNKQYYYGQCVPCDQKEKIKYGKY